MAPGGGTTTQGAREDAEHPCKAWGCQRRGDPGTLFLRYPPALQQPLPLQITSTFLGAGGGGCVPLSSIPTHPAGLEHGSSEQGPPPPQRHLGDPLRDWRALRGRKTASVGKEERDPAGGTGHSGFHSHGVRAHIVEEVCPPFHGDALEDGQHSKEDVVELRDPIVGTDPLPAFIAWGATLHPTGMGGVQLL